MYDVELITWISRCGYPWCHEYVIEIATTLRDRGVFLRSLTEGFDTATRSIVINNDHMLPPNVGWEATRVPVSAIYGIAAIFTDKGQETAFHAGPERCSYLTLIEISDGCDEAWWRQVQFRSNL